MCINSPLWGLRREDRKFEPRMSNLPTLLKIKHKKRRGLQLSEKTLA